MIASLKVGAAAAAVGLAAGLGIGWAANGWRLGEKLAELEAEAGRLEGENRATERRWADHVIKLGDEANAEADRLRAAAARADAAGRSLLDAGGRHAAAAAAAPGTSEAAAAAIRLHAQLRREADEFAGEVAKHADAARAAGLACERFDAVTR